MLNESMMIDDYKPCRLSDIFLDENEEIEIMNKKGDGSFKLKGIGRIIWYMLDGKNNIKTIAKNLCDILKVDDEKLLHAELIEFLKMLNKRGAIIVNWHPLYKLDINQELA